MRLIRTSSEIYIIRRIVFLHRHSSRQIKKSVAIVGARGRSAYGCEVAKVLAAALSRQGIQIISGMARGIDRDAHMGCLEAGGNTYAVLGSGADTCYPNENRFLYDKIKVSGGIISELMPGTDPQRCFSDEKQNNFRVIRYSSYS